MKKKLYRNRKDKMVAGVLGGLGKYLHVDPTLLRLGFIALVILFKDLFGGLVVAYIVAAIIVPQESADVIDESDTDDSDIQISPEKNNKLIMLGGIALVVFGGIKLAERILNDFDIKIFDYSLFWPALLIVGGIYIIFVLGRKNEDE